MYYGIKGANDDTDKINKIFKKFSKISGQGSGKMKISHIITIPDNGVLEGCTVYITSYTNCYIGLGNNTIVRDNIFHGTGVKRVSNANSCCLYFWRVKDIVVLGNSFYDFKALIIMQDVALSLFRKHREQELKVIILMILTSVL
jgi:hypothetical protein